MVHHTPYFNHIQQMWVNAIEDVAKPVLKDHCTCIILSAGNTFNNHLHGLRWNTSAAATAPLSAPPACSFRLTAAPFSEVHPIIFDDLLGVVAFGGGDGMQLSHGAIDCARSMSRTLPNCSKLLPLTPSSSSSSSSNGGALSCFP